LKKDFQNCRRRRVYNWTDSSPFFMKSSFRPTSVEDVNPLCQFLARAFAFELTAPMLKPSVIAWKYWDRRGDFAGPRSYVLEKDGVIVAHAGLWPLTFGAGESAVRGIHMIDWASAKESAGAGLAIVQKLASIFDFIVGIGGSEMTRKVLPAFGFVQYRQVWRGARPLHPIQQAMTHQTRNWKLAPRLVRNAMMGMTGATPYRRWTASQIVPNEVAQDLQIGPDDAHFAPRAPEFFEYILRCPAGPVTLHGIFDGGQLQGHFAICVLRGQARIAGVWLREPTEDRWTAAYFLAQKTASRLPGANEVVASGTEGASGAGAARAGFQVLDGPWVYLLDKKKKLSLPDDFQFQTSDDDEAFLDLGNSAYWS
jgi:hypothetical protein